MSKHGNYVLLLVTIGLGCTILASSGNAFIPPEKGARGTTEEALIMNESTPPTKEAAARWQAFVAVQGEDFSATWNPVTKTPHRIQGKGLKVAGFVSESNAAALVNDVVRSNANLLGADPDNLRLISNEKHGGRWYADFQQIYDGLDVIGGRVHVRLTENGAVTTLGSDFYPGIAVSTRPSLSEVNTVLIAKDNTGFDARTDNVLSSRLVVLPVVRGDQVTYYLAYEMRLKIERDLATGREPALWRVYVDANSGNVLQKQNEIRYAAVYGNVSGYIKPAYITDPNQQENFIDEYVDVTGYGQAITDNNGNYSIEAGSGGMRTVTAMLRGRWARILNNNGSAASFSDSVAPGSQKNILWTSPGSIASERNAYYHSGIVHNWIKTVDPSFTGMDRQTPIYVNEPNYCNAYWDGSGITIGAGSGSCQDLALFCDVLYHEYGHGIADYQYTPFSPSGAMHEAFADYTACTITNEPYIGEGLFGPGSYFRNIDNSLKYPNDLTGEVHDDGRILAGALWDLRETLAPNIHLADSLFHYARYGKADNFFDYYTDVLETDDDDGNLANGTPHYFEIVESFGKHGIGPGLYIDIAHTPIPDSEDSLAAFPVVAAITSNLALESDSLLLYYATGGGFTAVAMLPTVNPDEYSATIPHQTYGTTVTYYIYAKAQGRSDYATSPEGAPSTLHTFSIGLDGVAPVTSHTPLGDQPDAGWPSTVTATVTDNLGLASVVLEYFKNGQAQSSVAMANVPGTDEYAATFQVAASAGDYIEYRIVATDASSSTHTTYAPASGYNLFGIADAYYYTFETGAEGWTHSAPSGWNDQWHVSTQRNHTPGGGSAWKCGQTGTGAYTAHLNALLETPVIQIGEDAKLVFWYWMDAEDYEPVQGSDLAWDGAALSLVDSAGKATAIEPVGGYPYRILADSDAPFTFNKPVYSGHEGWKMAVFDLSHYRGSCKIRFKFGSDMALGFEGWYIDDVMIWSGGVLAGVGGGCGDDCVDPGLPAKFSLANALPNPTQGRMSIFYAVPSPGSHVGIQVFDVRGRLAASLVDEAKIPGRYTATWDGRDQNGTLVSPGIYFIRMEADRFRAGSKLVLVR